MPDPTTPATPPAATGGTFTIDEVKAIVAEAVKPLADQLKEVSAQAKIANDTLAALPPAKPADAPAAGAVTPEAVAKLVQDGIAGALKARDESASADAQAKAARTAKVAELVKTKLGGRADAANAFDGVADDKLESFADTLASQFKALRPDFGTTPNGGTPVNAPAGQAPAGNLTAGQAAYAATIKIPA